MAARDFEVAQRAFQNKKKKNRRDAVDVDEEHSSDDEDELIILSTGTISASPERQVLVTEQSTNRMDFGLSSTISSSSSSPSAFYDPYSRQSQTTDHALMDDDDRSVRTVETVRDENPQEKTQPSTSSLFHPTTTTRTAATMMKPSVTTSWVTGGAGYLEMEDVPPARYTSFESIEPITTSSGLLLTHRRPSPTSGNNWKSPGGGKKDSHSSSEGFSSSVSPNRVHPLRNSISPHTGNNNSSSSSSTRTTIIQHNGVETVFDKSDPLQPGQRESNQNSFESKQRQFFEVEHGFGAWKMANEQDFYRNDKDGRRHSMPMLQARRFLSYVRIWMVLSAVFLLLATGVLFHAFGHTTPTTDTVMIGTDSTVNNGSGVTTQYIVGGTTVANGGEVKKIILVPLPDHSQTSKGQLYIHQHQQEQVIAHQIHHQQQQVMVDQNQHHQHHPQQRFHYPLQSMQHHHHQQQEHGAQRVLKELRQEFDDWVTHHGKKYHSAEEKEHRFRIWTDNHHRTIQKNDKHGPCRLTNQPVFGSNHFKDLSPDEFKAQYLTGYNPPGQEELDERERRLSPQKRALGTAFHKAAKTLEPGLHRVNMHDSIKQRLLQDHGDRILKQQEQNHDGYSLRKANCDWYDVACVLRWLWNEAGVQFGAVIGTMEPRYNANAYPNAIDWRDYGIVTSVRSQGNCGACWAITAVETVESAHALSTGNLYDLSEAEIITCDTSCEMCNGGWPQNAFEWVMKYGGLPLYNSYPYDGDKLLAMSDAMESDGSSSRYSYYSWTKDSVESYREKVCPSGDGGKKGGDSQDYWKDGGKNDNYADNSDKGRYGNIKGYGYATDRCICYSDGSGCTCNKQNEQLAVANLATYGPAVVCVDAALWQDYSGGILTADIGCGSEFMDVNHCAQVVGYAYTDTSDGGEGGGGGGGGSRDDRQGGGSHDQSSGTRTGYWILRNSWTGYWGMHGYAYIAMGENTCGILNDMTQAYL